MRRAVITIVALVHCASICAQTTDTDTAAVSPSVRYALPVPAATLTRNVDGVDRAKALAEDSALPKSAPLRYALGRTLHDIAIDAGKSRGGVWIDLPDGKALWRLPVHATGAVSLDFGFRRMFLPQGAELYVGNGQRLLGPYTDADNPRSGEFWTPIVYGEDALIEVLLPRRMQPFLQLDLGTVHVGYRDLLHPKSFVDPTSGSGICNVDTICPQGNPWRSEINAEAIISFTGALCSGQLLNNTRGDHTGYFSTANHCISTQSDAASVVVYWKYESPVCRVVNSVANGAPVPTGDSIPQTGGAALVATFEPGDFTLIRLNNPPPSAANVHWNGWDRTDNAFSNGTILHHPQADAKRISFTANNAISLDDMVENGVPGDFHWHVATYSQGTTEPGSSGSGLLDASHRLRGVLSGGAASCDFNFDDYYGRMSVAWNGGGTPATSLHAWLDPTNSGVQTLDASGGCQAPAVSLATSENPAKAGDPVTLSAAISGGTPPYTIAFDVDGDGSADVSGSATSIVAVYPSAFSGNVSVTVSDSASCPGSATRALNVVAPDIVVSAGTPVHQCGNVDSSVDPGERWSLPLTFTNVGGAATTEAYAVIAQDLSVPGPAGITLETPAIALPVLASGQHANANASFTIDHDAACGAALKLNYIATVDRIGYSGRSATVFQTVLGSGGTCVVANCNSSAVPITPSQGNFFDALRSGNGLTEVLTPIAGADPVLFAAWFTGDSARAPIWYAVNAALHANQVNSKLFQTHQNAPNQFPESATAVGTAQISLVAADKFVYTWTLNGRSGGGLFTPVVPGVASTLRSWYNPAQSGWGLFDQLFAIGAAGTPPVMFNLAYIYDSSGAPRWTVAQDEAYIEGATLNAAIVRPTCPGCVWLDYLSAQQAAGTLAYHVSGAQISINTDLTLPAPLAGTWVRNALPLTPLVPPQ